MRRFRLIAFAFFLALLTWPAYTDVVSPPMMLDVLGSVTNAARPVANALVIALNLKDLAAIQTYSLADGSFTLPPLPAGIYKIIAVKQGFAPAITTVVPNKPSHRVSLALESEKKRRAAADDEMWQIRASLPPDILHQIDLASAQPVPGSNTLPRMKGEMISMTGMTDQASSAAFAKTSVGVEGRLTDSWRLGIHGNLHRVDDPTDDQRSSDPAAESSVMSMELRSSPTDSYKVASTKSTWRYHNTPNDRQADIRSHDFEWEHGDAKVGVRYFAQENLFASNPLGSDLIEITGGTRIVQTRRNDVGVTLRVTQESLHNSPLSPLRTADLTANASVMVVPRFLVHYGLSARTTLDRTELAPRTGMEWKFGKETALVLDGMVKALDPDRNGTILPAVGTALDDGRVLPRYAVSAGVTSGQESGSHFSAVASVTAFESPLRVIFNDGSEHFWDGLYIDSGDIRREIRISGRRDLGSKLAIDISTRAGTATPTHSLQNAKSYVAGDIQSIFFPTGTTLLISYRELRQPQPQGVDYHSEHVNLRMAQSLHLPFDLKILLGFEVAHSENSPFLVDLGDEAANGMTRRYVGGLAVNF